VNELIGQVPRTINLAAISFLLLTDVGYHNTVTLLVGHHNPRLSNYNSEGIAVEASVNSLSLASVSSCLFLNSGIRLVDLV